MKKTRTLKRILGAVTAAALSLSAVGFSNQIFKYDNGGYELTASAVTEIADGAALLAINTAGEYQLTADIEISSTWDVSADITLDLNGHGIKQTGATDVIKITNGTLTINDSAPETAHSITLNSYRGTAVADGTGTDSVTNGTGTAYFTGGYITGGKPVYYNSIIEDGGGITLYGGNCVMNGGNIIGNTGEGVWVYDGTFTMNNGKMMYNQNGIRVRAGSDAHHTAKGASTAKFNMYNGTISHNNIGIAGCCCYGPSIVTIYDGNISNNNKGIHDDMWHPGFQTILKGGSISNNTDYGIQSLHLTIDGEVTISGNTNWDITIGGDQADCKINETFAFSGVFSLKKGRTIDFAAGTKITGTPKVKISGIPNEENIAFDFTKGCDPTQTFALQDGETGYSIGKGTSTEWYAFKGTTNDVTFVFEDNSQVVQKVGSGGTATALTSDFYNYTFYTTEQRDAEFDFSTTINDSNTIIYVAKVPKTFNIKYYEVDRDTGVSSHISAMDDTYTYGTAKSLTNAEKSGSVIDSWFTDEGLTIPATGILATDYGDKTFYGAWRESSGGGQSYEIIEESPFTFHYYGGSGMVLAEYDDSLEDVVIPSTVNGIPVTEIGSGSFNSCTKIKSLVIPSTVKTIANSAFWGCGIEEIDIPETVNTIESSAFSNCKNLKKIVIRNKNCSIDKSGSTICNGYIKSKYDYSGEIYGNRGSTAEQYATKYGYKFIPFEGEDSAVYTVFYYGTADEVTAKLCTSEYENEGAMDKDFVISGKEIWSMRFVVDKYADEVEFSRKTSSGWSTPEKVAVLDSAENFLSKATTLKNGAKCAVVKGEADIVSVAFVEDDSKVITGTTDKYGKLTAINIQDEEDDGTQYFFTIKGEKVTAPTPAARTGYTFLNWEDIKGNKYAPGASVKTEPAENEKVLVIKAKWKCNTHKVSFDLNGGSGSIAAQNVNDGAKAKKPTDPKRSGKSFVRWVVAANSGSYVKGSEFNFNSAVTSDVKLVAEWKHVHTYCSLQLNDPIFKGAFKNYCTDTYLAAAHVKMCADGDDYCFEAHHFDENGKCSCGYQRKVEYVTVAVYGGSSSKVVKNSSYTATAPERKGNQIFNCWGYSTDGRTFKVLSFNRSVTFTVPCNVIIYPFYKEEPLTAPKASLTASKYSEGLLFRLDYQLPDGWTATDCVVSVGDNNQIHYYYPETVTVKSGSNKGLFNSLFNKKTTKKTVYYSREDNVLSAISQSALKDKMFAKSGITAGNMELYTEAGSQKSGNSGLGYLYMGPSATSKNGNSNHIYYSVGYLVCRKPDGSRTTIKLGAIAASYNNPSLVK